MGAGVVDRCGRLYGAPDRAQELLAALVRVPNVG